VSSEEGSRGKSRWRGEGGEVKKFEKEEKVGRSFVIGCEVTRPLSSRLDRLDLPLPLVNCQDMHGPHSLSII
jgi:hypothetical protein